LDSLYFHYGTHESSVILDWASRFSPDPDENSTAGIPGEVHSETYPRAEGDSIVIKYISTYCTGGAEYSVFTGRFSANKDSITGTFYRGPDSPAYNYPRGKGLMVRA